MSELTTEDQFEELYNSDKVTVFTFSADWCPDCHFIEPFMPNLVEKYKDYQFVYVDRDKWMNIAQDWMVMGIPSFVVTKEKEELGRFVSKMRKTEKEIDEFLNQFQ